MPQKGPKKPLGKLSVAQVREQRRAEALRANLRRRKAASAKPSGKADPATE